MESETPSAPVVNKNDEQICGDFPEKIPDELGDKVRRLDGYAAGVFANGKPSEQMRYLRRKFAKCLGISWDHTDRVTRVWMRWTTAFDFRRERFGRSTCLVITPRRRPLKLKTEEVRRRLAGAIRNHVTKSGRVRVGRKFLLFFFRRYGLPAEQILSAWRSLYYVEGAVCQWKTGQGERYLFVQTADCAAASSQLRQAGGRAKNFKKSIAHQPLSRNPSPRHSTSGISPPTGGKDQKQGASAPDLQTGSSVPLRGTQKDGEGQCDGFADGLSPPGFALAPRGGRGDPRPKPALKTPGFGPWKPEIPPLRVCDRWIAGKKLRAKANFLAFRMFPPMHAQAWRVKFGPMHSRNFAETALRAGFVDAEICRAYRAGLTVAHEAAAREWHGDISAEGFREPSQAIKVAWGELGRDGRTAEQRWAAFFLGEVAPQLREYPHAESGETRAAPEPARGPGAERWRDLPGGERIRETDSPNAVAPKPAREDSIAPAVARMSFAEPKTFEAHLRASGMTLADLLKLPRAEQTKFVRAAQAAQKTPPAPPASSP
jgi:hypothetical protein